MIQQGTHSPTSLSRISTHAGGEAQDDDLQRKRLPPALPLLGTNFSFFFIKLCEFGLN